MSFLRWPLNLWKSLKVFMAFKSLWVKDFMQQRSLWKIESALKAICLIVNDIKQLFNLCVYLLFLTYCHSFVLCIYKRGINCKPGYFLVLLHQKIRGLSLHFHFSPFLNFPQHAFDSSVHSSRMYLIKFTNTLSLAIKRLEAGSIGTTIGVDFQ